jgi:hypothetical protein
LSLCMRDLLPFKRLFLAVVNGIGLAEWCSDNIQDDCLGRQQWSTDSCKNGARSNDSLFQTLCCQVPLVPFTFDPKSSGSQQDRYRFAEGRHFHQGIANR